MLIACDPGLKYPLIYSWRNGRYGGEHITRTVCVGRFSKSVIMAAAI